MKTKLKTKTTLLLAWRKIIRMSLSLLKTLEHCAALVMPVLQ